MSEPPKTHPALQLIGGLFLVGWDFWSQRPEETQFLFYLGLFLIALAVQQFFHASNEAQRGVVLAFTLVLWGTLLRDLAAAFARGDSRVWTLAAVTLAMALLSFYLYRFRSDRPSPVPGIESLIEERLTSSGPTPSARVAQLVEKARRSSGLDERRALETAVRETRARRES